MRYRFVFAATLAILALASSASYGQDAASDPPPLNCNTVSDCKALSECRTQRGVVLVSPDAPHKPIKVFCADDLKRFDCQILDHIKNYIFYSYGGCENKSDMYGKVFGRPACNRDETIPIAEIRPFFRTLSRTEYEKGCLPPNFTPDN
jgi:hypothetical protein